MERHPGPKARRGRTGRKGRGQGRGHEKSRRQEILGEARKGKSRQKKKFVPRRHSRGTGSARGGGRVTQAPRSGKTEEPELRTENLSDRRARRHFLGSEAAEAAVVRRPLRNVKYITKNRIRNFLLNQKQWTIHTRATALSYSKVVVTNHEVRKPSLP